MKQPIDSAKDVANAAGDAISKTASFFTSTIIGIGKSVFHPISTAGNSHRRPAPGTAPGIEHYLEKEGAETPVRITVVDYGADFYDTNEYSDIGEALNLPRKEAQRVRWINVDGLNPKIVDRVCKHFGVHTLSAEDVLNTYQRPKLEAFSDHIQIIVRQIQVLDRKLKNSKSPSFFLKTRSFLSKRKSAMSLIPCASD